MAVGPLQPSGRVIAGGRLLLACLFLLAVWADASQPARAQTATYTLLTAYVVWSLAVTLLVWNNWWQDARLAAPAHVIDVAVFMIMLYATEGYTSPYFVFFIFILLAAAIRWGWRETAVTATAITAIYFAAGLIIDPTPAADFEPFIVRAGHLFIISAILIWFGANQWAAWPRLGFREPPSGPVGGDPMVAALQAGMAAIGARRGVLLWRGSTENGTQAVSHSDDGTARSAASGALPQLPGALLFDLSKDRVLMRGVGSRWRYLTAVDIFPATLRRHVQAPQGLAIPVTTGLAGGLAVFQEVRALSTDHLDLAPRIARDMAARLQEAELLAAVEERSVASARVAVARDLHDSVVQFLAGLGFRLEALNRSPEAKGTLAAGLAELKDSVMEEQRHLRAFVQGLRTGGAISLADLARDCESLCQLLARQWGIDCAFTAEADRGSVPMRMQLDIQQLIREAVANAARHGGATRVAVSLRGQKNHLRLTVVDDGRGFGVQAGEEVPPPASLNARVREARGKLKVRSNAGDTSVVIHLPVEAAA